MRLPNFTKTTISFRLFPSIFSFFLVLFSLFFNAFALGPYLCAVFKFLGTFFFVPLCVLLVIFFLDASSRKLLDNDWNRKGSLTTCLVYFFQFIDCFNVS